MHRTLLCVLATAITSHSLAVAQAKETAEGDPKHPPLHDLKRAMSQGDWMHSISPYNSLFPKDKTKGHDNEYLGKGKEVYDGAYRTARRDVNKYEVVKQPRNDCIVKAMTVLWHLEKVTVSLSVWRPNTDIESVAYGLIGFHDRKEFDEARKTLESEGEFQVSDLKMNRVAGTLPEKPDWKRYEVKYVLTFAKKER